MPLDALHTLETEARNPRTTELDTLSPAELVAALHRENHTVAEAVQAILPDIARAVELIAARWERGGRLLYVGAGTSGRLGVLDASECPPTFGTPPEQVQGIIAGGLPALTTSIEGAEDDTAAGAEAIVMRNVNAADVVVGIAASGRTPYVIGALSAARTAGAATVALVNVLSAEMARYADLTLAAVTGPEPLTGSTRLLAGTAQKMVLNLLTTATMVRTGKVYGNLMVDVRATNAKLRDRAVRIVMTAAQVERSAAETALLSADGQARTAIVMLRCTVSAEEARLRLAHAGGRVCDALT